VQIQVKIGDTAFGRNSIHAIIRPSTDRHNGSDKKGKNFSHNCIDLIVIIFSCNPAGNQSRRA
jgi:hypothetical protein